MISWVLGFKRRADQFCNVLSIVEHGVEDDEVFGAVAFTFESDYGH
mgnify:CR=1 FL=1